MRRRPAATCVLGWLAASALALVGCGESPSSILDGGGGVDARVVDAGALCRAEDGVLTALHERLRTCAPDRDDGLDAVAFEPLCRASVEPYLADGTLELADATAVAACRAYVATVACADLAPTRLGPCAAVVRGQQAIGAACELDAQCAPGGHCGPGDGCGTCQPLAAVGAACDRHAGCVTGRCAAGTCAEPAPLAAACVDDGDCAGALRCLAGSCAAATGAESGAPCLVALDACAPTATGQFCAGDAELDATGHCRAFAARGEACVSLGTWPGAWCDWTVADRCVNGACAAGEFGADGAPCDPEAPCEAGLVCRDDGTCAAPLGAGAACVEVGACAAPLGCVAGRCQLGPYTAACPAP